MTISTADFGALYAWILLTIAIIPVALVFARLSTKYPHAGGPAYFVEQAFGPVAGRTIGMVFLLVVPLGAPAALLMTYQFIDAFVTLSAQWQLVTQLGLLALIYLLNYRGIHISAKLQFLLTFTIVAIVVLLFAKASNNPPVNLNSFNTEFVTQPILVAAGIAFWSFLGIEAMAHLSADFESPEQDLIPAIMIGTILVGLIYVISTLLVLMVPTETNLSMIGVFDYLLGGYGTEVIGILGIAGGVATVNVYTASIARLAWSFSNDGVLPGYFSKLNQHGVPQRSLSALLMIMALVLVLSTLSGKSIEDLIGWSNGVFVIIYFASMLAATKLLPKQNHGLIILGCLFCLMVFVGLGWHMSYALILIAIVVPFLYWQHAKQLTKASVAN